MAPVQSLKLFEDSRIRALWDENEEEWYFSIVDIVAVLTGTSNPRRYWSDLKRKLDEEGSQLYDFIVQLKMLSEDGKRYKTDCATTQGVLRVIQSIPSPKAEPFKLWLAQVGAERIEETIDPEQAIDRALETYLKKGYSPRASSTSSATSSRRLQKRLTRIRAGGGSLSAIDRAALSALHGIRHGCCPAFGWAFGCALAKDGRVE